jgi:DNA-binding transcriptional MerR regulator
MGTLEKITQMKEQGLSEPQIIDSLKKEGVAPREINEVLSQSKIKSAVAAQEIPSPDNSMQPSMGAENYPPQNAPEQNYPAQIPYPDAGAYPPQAQEQEYSAMAPQEMQQEGYYPEYSQQGVNIDTINDIAEQIFEEKNSEIRRQVSEFIKFQEEAGYAVQKIEERLTRLENTFNEMQTAILKKVGDYGQDIKDISSEMKKTQETFSTIVAPITKNISDLKDIAKSKK